jgi:hypothetical protein
MRWFLQVSRGVLRVKSDRRGIGALLAVLGALAWSLGFAIWAYVGAAGTECIVSAGGEGGSASERCRSTPLVDGFGRELLLVLLPALVCLVVWALLRGYCTRGIRVARAVAAALAALFVVFCWLTGLSIGLLLAPIALLLVVAVTTTEAPPSEARLARRWAEGVGRAPAGRARARQGVGGERCAVRPLR